MENEFAAGGKPTEPAGNSNHTMSPLTIWNDISRNIPAGLFLMDHSEALVHLNPHMRSYLRMEEEEPSPVLEEYFWSRLEMIAGHPGQAHGLITEARKSLSTEQSAEFKLETGNGDSLLLRLFPIPAVYLSENCSGGIAYEQLQGLAAYQRQTSMLEELSVQARKTSASATGNFAAMAENLQIWSPEVLGEFLRDTRGQLDLVNQTLDLILNLIRTAESTPLFTDTVHIFHFLQDVLSNQNQMDFRLADNQVELPEPPLALIDPALTRLALEYLMKEILSSNPAGQLVEVSLIVGEKDLIIKFENPRTLPLPGLSPERQAVRISDQNIRMYLVKKIFEAQNGSIHLEWTEPDAGVISRVEISLPVAHIRKPAQSHLAAADPDARPEGRILLADAQPEYQIRLRESLQEAGYRVDLAVDGSIALDLARSINPDLVIVARNLPALDGLLITQGIRRWSAVPIIMLSERSDPGDLLYAYQLGVDDYLRKPVSIQELIVRAQVCLRRSANSKHTYTADLFQSNLLRIDYSTRQVWIRGEMVDLTPIEYNLMVFMSRQGKQIMPYEQLLESVWEGPEKGTRQGLFVHVKRLREKIEIDPQKPQIITNKWGVGYVFNP
jgi:two-component system KDP operon response regulator KdpE